MKEIRVALIDDDPAVLDSLRLYFQRRGLLVSGFSGAGAFLEAMAASSFDCIVTDVRMPGLSGLDLVRHLADARSTIPIILITGHGDVDMAVNAIKAGAFDFIEKPFNESRLLDAIHNAAKSAERMHHDAAELSELRTRFASLTDRQRQVLELAAMGLSNKEIGARLGISNRTVDVHRAWMMERMGARNIAELVRMTVRLGIGC